MGGAQVLKYPASGCPPHGRQIYNTHRAGLTPLRPPTTPCWDPHPPPSVRPSESFRYVTLGNHRGLYKTRPRGFFPPGTQIPRGPNSLKGTGVKNSCPWNQPSWDHCLNKEPSRVALNYKKGIGLPQETK